MLSMLSMLSTWRMWRMWTVTRVRTAVILVTGGLAVLVTAGAGAAAAQPVIVLPDHPTVSGSIGFAANGDDYSGSSAADVSAALEVPLVQPYRVRVAAGRVAWGFSNRSDGKPQWRDTITVTRATASLIKVVVPPLVGSSVGFYLGAGPGLYHWGFDRGSGAVGTRLGVHGLVGVEYSIAGERFVVGYEAQLHAVRGPTSAHVASYEFLVLQGSMGVKYRF